MDGQKQDDRLEPIYNNAVQIQDVAWKLPPGTIETGGESRSGKSVLAAQHDDNDDIYLLQVFHNTSIYLYQCPSIFFNKYNHRL